jgi:hypothetical protein
MDREGDEPRATSDGGKDKFRNTDSGHSEGDANLEVPLKKSDREKVYKAMERIATYQTRYTCNALDWVDRPYTGLSERYADFYDKNAGQNWYFDFKITESDKAAEARLTALALFLVAENDVKS